MASLTAKVRGKTYYNLSDPRMFKLLRGIRETLVFYQKTQDQRQPSTASALFHSQLRTRTTPFHS
jgi:hypothetical protein